MPRVKPLTFRSLEADWKDCKRCPLCEHRSKVVLARGYRKEDGRFDTLRLPADVLLIGEAPGDSEDAIGLPFVGPAGQLLDRIVLDALEESGLEQDFGEGPAPRMAWTNLVACIPKDDTNRKKGEPTGKEIEACRPRLEGFMKLVKPKLIVAVGSLSDKYAKVQGWEKTAPVVTIAHPSYILRMDVANQGLAIQQATIKLSDAFADYLVPGT